MPKPQPTVFDRPIAQRVTDATQYVERLKKNGPPPAGAYTPPWNPGCLPAEVTTAIPAGSRASPSNTGRITLSRPDGDGGLKDAETDQVCKNYHNAGAAVGKTITVYWMDGCYWLVAIDC